MNFDFRRSIRVASIFPITVLSCLVTPIALAELPGESGSAVAIETRDVRDAIGVRVHNKATNGKGPTAVIALVPVDPPVELSDYGVEAGKGTLADGVGRYPTRVWVELRISGWAPATLASWQVTIDPGSFTSGEIGELVLPDEPCTTHDWCEGVFGRGARCVATDSDARQCTPAFQNPDRTDWLFDCGAGESVEPPYDRFIGTTETVGPLQDNGSFVYGGTLVVDVPPDAKGQFTIGPLEDSATVLLDVTRTEIPVALMAPASVHAPTGACCWFDGDDEGCVDDSTRTECRARAGTTCWRLFDHCFNGCTGCLFDGNCDDSNACTVESCDFSCHYCVRELAYDVETQCCDPATGALSPLLSDGDPCTNDECNQFEGELIHIPIPQGGACSYDPCMRNETCNATGECIGEPHLSSSCPKNRFVSFNSDAIWPETCGGARAIRVTLVDVKGFEGFNGQIRWVGEPSTYTDGSGPNAESLVGAPLSCEPYFRDWSLFDVVRVFGEGVVPGSVYHLDAVDEACADLGDMACYYGSMTVTTAKWGDVVPPFEGIDSAPPQPDFTDIAALVEKFTGAPDAPGKVREILQPSVPKPLALVSFSDIAAAIDAFSGAAYPIGGPCPCSADELCPSHCYPVPSNTLF